MKVGILTREFKNADDVYFHGVPLTYLKAIDESLYPVLIDNSLDLQIHKEELIKQLKTLDGIIIPGGDTISLVDLLVIDYCYNNDIPLLGICLGMQEIAYYFNQDNLEKLPNSTHFDLHQKYLHKIQIAKNSYLYRILTQETISVNSRHKYQVKEDPHYSVEAKSLNDKVIEAIKVKDKKYIMGVQFHPEIMLTYFDKNAQAIFNDFISILKA